jgi:hypothetical protein
MSSLVLIVSNIQTYYQSDPLPDVILKITERYTQKLPDVISKITRWPDRYHMPTRIVDSSRL